MTKNITHSVKPRAWTHCGTVHTVDGKRVCPDCTKITRCLPWHDPLGAQPVDVEPVFLVKRINKRTGDWFYGCPNFPRCRHSENRPKTKAERSIETRAWANALYNSYQ
jgi:hypothetical protein